MSHKSKGINGERELVHLFWANKWVALRIAGSGSSRYPSPDLLASNSVRKLAIEVKITKEQYKHFPGEEISDLKEFSQKFGAEPWIAVKFKGNDWFFVSLEDLQQTTSNFSISLELAKRRGLSFSELIKAI
jgi:Holliday junction resolvase